ncbi:MULTISPECIES: OsmC family protein [Streptomyces]|uniref:OsmC family peroxiredoxin n=2 Tax=Streptomyces TaxID=1883 RepID=A0A3R7F3L3_9ACTN|nr:MULTISPECIES: OsmC family protein [Streptomyces]MZE80751.1 OsmC family peroxiredoxin [Streptomyces sp. SID5475]KNE79304.1 osmotically inducible protein OsmC [Streptomyces fradiae]MCC5033875.1 OsmC family protein [Streptomyces sp. WAC 00631]MCC9742735.1 OsmC family protein [Streptomyces sp. MNU89]OFA34002.1 osmotically inducible protein OsmC [Streptomyces fradiae]
MQKMTVNFLDGESYSVAVRGHEFTVDQPLDAGGDDLGPTPVELFTASLATCVGYYAGRYLARHGLPREGLRVETEFALAGDRPARVGEVRMRLVVPGELPEQRRKALAAVVNHCTVHNSIRQPPHVVIDVD